MGWRDLLQTDNGQDIICPWIGDRSLQTWLRSWDLKRLPREFGWHIFNTKAKEANWIKSIDADLDLLKNKQTGYLVGDRFVPSTASAVAIDVPSLIKDFQKVYLIEPGIDRFQRITVGQFYENSPLIFSHIEMPLGPEDDVMNAFLDGEKDLNKINGVTPALDAAFRFEVWNRDEAEKFRKAEEERRRLEEERLAKEKKREELIKTLGNAITRREMAKVDFAEAARAALILSNAEYLDHRAAPNLNEMIVRFRFMRQRFECVCNKNTLRIIDSGICLTAHDYDDDEFSYGTKGDDWLTLESFPSVIKEAIDLGKLVVYRHA